MKSERTLAPRPLHTSLLALALAAPMLVGCGARGGGRAPAQYAERVGPATAEVGDEGFAAAVHDLLVSDPGSTERRVRLGAVESRQMARADARFKSRNPERGFAALSAALELSARGDEGRARAVYDLLVQVAPEADRADMRSHIAALDTWMRDAVATGGPVASAGGLEKAAAHRRL